MPNTIVIAAQPRPTPPLGEPVSVDGVAYWITRYRGYPSTLAHDIAQARARAWRITA